MPSLSQLDEEEKVTDFRSRYAAETADMPANLAAIASRNLAAEDASLAKVNAVSRLLPQPASVPVEFSDSPQSAIRNPQSISDLHTDDISTRRSDIDDREKFIKARLGVIQPREAGLAAVVLAGPKERKELLQTWEMLEREKVNLLREHQIVSGVRARTADETFARQKHIDASNDFSNLAGRLLEIRKATKRGTSERADALLQAAVDFPAGFKTEAGQTIVRQMSLEQDAAAALTPPGYEKVPSSVSAEGKISYKLTPKETVDLEKTEEALKNKYGLTLKDIKAPDNIESGNRDSEGKFVNANKGTHFRVTTKGAGGSEFVIPRAEFEAFGGHIGEADKIEPNAAPTTNEIKSQAEYDTLPTGATFIYKGKRGKKP